MNENGKKEEKVITLDTLFDALDREAAFIKRELEYIKEDPNSKYNHSEEFMKGYKLAVLSMFGHLRDELGYPEIRHATDEEKKEFTIKSKFTATSLDVGINSIYGIKIEEGKEYETEEVPFGIMEYRGEKIPVYSDDPGQQDYCIYKGKTISGGSYNFNPEQIFAYEIDHSKFYESIKVEETTKEGEDKDGEKL